MNGTLVSDLGLGPVTWLFLSLLGCVMLFFKFSRFWSIRNLDLILMFAMVPGMMMIVGNRPAQPFVGVHPAVPRLGRLAGALPGRLGILATAVARTQPERLGLALPVGRGARPAAGRDRQPARRGGSAAEPGRPVGRVRNGRPAAVAGRGERGGQAGDRDRPPARLAEARAAAGDPLAGPGGAGASGAGERALADRLEALRSVDHWAVDGGVLPDLALHPDGACGQRPVDPRGADHLRIVLARPTHDLRPADRPCGRLGAGLPGLDRFVGRVLQGEVPAPISAGGGFGGVGLRPGGLVRAGALGLGPRAGRPEHRRRRPAPPVRAAVPTAASGSASTPATGCRC